MMGERRQLAFGPAHVEVIEQRANAHAAIGRAQYLACQQSAGDIFFPCTVRASASLPAR
jgi:hypothetical protein